MRRLEDRVAIITGAGRGIGKAVAELMAKEGASIVVNDLGSNLDGSGNSKQPADEVVEYINENGGSAVASSDSVSEFQSSKQIIDCAMDNFGKLDILVNCAGILRDRMIFNMTEEEWDSVIQVHLKGTFNMVKHSIDKMLPNRYGRIVLCASSSGLGASGQANYAAAKEGIVGFSRAVASEVSDYGISINSIYPGGTSRMTQSVPQTTRDLRKALMQKRKVLMYKRCHQVMSHQKLITLKITLLKLLIYVLSKAVKLQAKYLELLGGICHYIPQDMLYIL